MEREIQVECQWNTCRIREWARDLSNFLTSPINSKWDTVQFSELTMSKLLEQVLWFMYFAKHHKNIIPLSLSIFNSEAVVSDYVAYLSKSRKLMPSTISSHLSVAINVIKYNYRDDPVSSHCCSQILAHRRVQRQLTRQARLFSKRAKEGLTTKSSQQFRLAYVLETLRNLHQKYLEAKGVAKARFLHDFVLISTYLRAIPSRSSEIQSLKLLYSFGNRTFRSWDKLQG